MPIKKSAYKALRRTKKRTLRNEKVKNGLNVLLKKSRQSIAEKKIEAAKKLVAQTVKALDKATKHGIIKKNTASRKKSKIMKALNSLGK